MKNAKCCKKNMQANTVEYIPHLWSRVNTEAFFHFQFISCRIMNFVLMQGVRKSSFHKKKQRNLNYGLN